jgi:tRNA nucleotidyltransferase/poly(A) polymerase
MPDETPEEEKAPEKSEAELRRERVHKELEKLLGLPPLEPS